MKRLTIVILACFILFSYSNAQEKTKPKFTSLNQVGVAWGASGDGLQVQSINGVSYKTFSAGVGVGLDYYWERTVPVFIDVRKNIFSKKQTPFLYVDLGTNLPWVKDKEVSWSNSEYDDGSYYDFGIGYKAPFYKKIFVNMSFGCSVKKLHEKKVLSNY